MAKPHVECPRGGEIAAKRCPLREFTARYLDVDSGLLSGIEPGTRHGRTRVAERSFLRILRQQNINTIDRAGVGRWIPWHGRQQSTRRKGQPVSAKTVSNYHALLSAVFKSAVGCRLRDDNPALPTRLSNGIAHEATFLSPEEFRTLLYSIPDYFKPLVRFPARRMPVGRGDRAHAGGTQAVAEARDVPHRQAMEEGWVRWSGPQAAEVSEGAAHRR